MAYVYLEEKKTFDATHPPYFAVTTDLSDDNIDGRLYIRRQSNNKIAYKSVKNPSIRQKDLFSVSGGELQNGEEYYAYVAGIRRIGAEEIPYTSNYIYFSCYTSPTFSFVNIPSNKTIYNDSYDFYFEYNQAEGLPITRVAWTWREGTAVRDGGELQVVDGTSPYIDSIRIENIKSSDVSYGLYYSVFTKDPNITIDGFIDGIFIRYTRPEIIGKIDLKNNCKTGQIRVDGQIRNWSQIESNCSSVRIKRRIKGGEDAEWVILKEYDDILPGRYYGSFYLWDITNACNVEYEYAITAVVNEVESVPISGYVKSVFSDVFVLDKGLGMLRLSGDIQYGSNARNQKTGVFTPLGRQMPIVISNATLSYESGSVDAVLLSDNFINNEVFNRNELVRLKNQAKDFLTNKRPKILKDWNGNVWLISVTDNVNVSYLQGSGMGFPQIQFNWVQIGDANKENDLKSVGMN